MRARRIGSALVALVVLWAPLAFARHHSPIEIIHTKLSTAVRDQELSVRADIIAPAGAYMPTLYYRQVGDSRYYSLPMLRVPGSLDVYTASVPGLFVTKDLEYYLESYDTLLHGPARSGDARHPILVHVVAPVVPPSHVLVRSDPSDATIQIDGKQVGTTPWSGVLTPGSHDVLLEKKGFLQAASTLDVPEGRDLDTLRMLSPAAEQATFVVTSDPTGAKVSIDGEALGTTPLIAPSPDGAHTLTVELAGYARAERQILFSKDRSIETSFNLEKLPPEPALAITTEPPGATVTVDGKELGTTPFIGVVPAGDHALTLKLAGRQPADAQIIMPSDRDLDLRFTLGKVQKKHVPVLAVSSDPTGAEVFIDGKPVGKSPYLNRLAAGEHRIKLTAKGFEDYDKKILMPDQNDLEVTLALVKLPPPPGPSQVVLEAEPRGVDIAVDGKPAGTAPVTVSLVAGPHVAIAKKEGYRSTEERFTVLQGQGLQLKMELEPVPKGATNPLLSVQVDPRGAAVQIDGENVGHAPYSAPLPPGRHRIILSEAGYKPREENFVLPEDKAFELRYAVALEPLRKTVSLSTATELKAAAVAPKKPLVDLKAVHREQQGPRPAAAPPPGPAAPKASAQLQAQARLAQRLERQARSAQASVDRPQYGPLILAGLGAVSAAVGVLYGLQALNTAKNLTDPTVDAAGRSELLAEDQQEVKLGVGLGAGGVVLAVVGAVWAAWPRTLDFDPSTPAAGSGSDAARMHLSVSPSASGLSVGVGGGF